MHDLPEHQMIPVDANGNGPAVNVHHYECRCGNRACDRALVDLQGWKTEATTVLAAWEEVWVTAGRPGPLGGSKAVAVKAEFERLNAAAVAQDTAVDHLEAPAVTDPTPQQVIARQLRGAGMPTKWAVHDAPEVIEALADAGYEIQPISEPADSDDGIDLTDTEATALAWRVCCEAVAALVDAGRLDWEDFPNLTETAWEKVAAAIDSTVVDSIRFTADSYDRAHGLDSRRLHREATR